MNNEDIKQELMRRGVTIDCPESVSIDDSIDPSRISAGAVIHSGCRLSGEKTSIGHGTVLGAEAPVTLDNCQVGHNVQLKGGYFSNATMLDDVSFGSGAHVRGGTLLEEYSSCAHTVGLKQTLLMPFSTLGSLINFCDCALTGGSGPNNHSEVGSSYIHFNFTAHQDKATPSLAGNVPQGVLLNQAPIFLGGQGGLVGPTLLAFGTVVAAGTICRRDVVTEGRLVFGQTGGRVKETSYDLRTYGDIKRIVKNNFTYIANLCALYAWYHHIRPLMMRDNVFTKFCIEGAKEQLKAMVGERIKRLGQLADKVAISLEVSGKERSVYRQYQEDFVSRWPVMAEDLKLSLSEYHVPPVELVDAVKNVAGENYVKSVQSLSATAQELSTAWLQGIVNNVSDIMDVDF